jgi:hypothetical protein
MTQPRRQQTPHNITLLTSSGCHLCEMAKDVIHDATADYELTITIVDLASPEGQNIATLHRMPFPPLILIDGKVHANGRLSAKKFRRSLDAMDAQTVAKS